MRKTHMLLFAVALLVPGCAAKLPHPVPATKVVFLDVVKETKRPCPVKKPVRPAPLARPLPPTASQLVDLLTAKLAEWAGDGGYGDKADAALDTCIRP